jgi:hypothetical protein
MVTTFDPPADVAGPRHGRGVPRVGGRPGIPVVGADGVVSARRLTAGVTASLTPRRCSQWPVVSTVIGLERTLLPSVWIRIARRVCDPAGRANDGHANRNGAR